MSTYVIGDIQGCFHELENLLTHIQFNPHTDTLWFTGDLVNRGPHSLDTLRYIKNLGPKHRTVLGNHDLHLLALSYNAHSGWDDDTVIPILNAPDRDELLSWLSQQPLMIYEERFNCVMVHAGLAANWDLAKAQQLAREVETMIKSQHAVDFFKHMYSNQPNKWHDDLQGWERLRCITNYFTRSRFCYADGSLELENKGTPKIHPQHLIPWFAVPERLCRDINILFGHWAALGGVTDSPNAIALDTGCVWGFSLTALRLDDNQRFSVSCSLQNV